MKDMSPPELIPDERHPRRSQIPDERRPRRSQIPDERCHRRSQIPDERRPRRSIVKNQCFNVAFLWLMGTSTFRMNDVPVVHKFRMNDIPVVPFLLNYFINDNFFHLLKKEFSD